MCIVAELDFYDVVRNFDLSRVAAKDLRRVRESRFDVVRWPVTCAHKKLADSTFRGAGKIQSLGYLGADYITLVHRHGDCSEDADDCDNDHEFNQREAVLPADC